MIEQTLPSYITKYFWDVQPEKINIQTNKKYIIERLLEYGNEEALRWINSIYTPQDINKVIRTSKLLSRKSGVFYSLYFDINPQDILCLQKDFQNKHRQIWNY
ncbi:hypothetical protein A3A93_00315 [Candidatus Roizmanbacteria bacterium RIFCSPLOWO2_01_FULL_38_12]|uniref:DUF6922 domain-containing protein n=1 Tax=Candidatus Roizmanbacteria bacterium RIFCSPLOWO2_01_FULL_38_12 TaxID=1802061 RepID=A0A1F7IUE8_9BACT|nr:MAG: hypothetical protein A2861_00850 [Candidatus Roizmanbacteria bacterium RIFCSPHIGHO2_01_FULL_38_15]OGK34709.1 MAG: hypothetical protein A3F59_01135 [Candidatus Roizmanbacteria bacterium RIFCSPHIGHO2_12_FULL_38_13]OGK46985.1 MAG: hypothetical protein A3A93_00315 [Candidatus Roizmanbacteria bacterium RIFCSPLOWO2_01_FULL_38_12]